MKTALITGCNGLVGSSLVRKFLVNPFFSEVLSPKREELDLFQFSTLEKYLKYWAIVFLAVVLVVVLIIKKNFEKTISGGK